MELQFKRTSTMGERIFSFLLDHLIFTVILAIGIINVIMTSTEQNKLIWGIILVFAILFIYLFKDIIEGRSIGKRAFGIGVRCADNPNEIPHKLRLFLRNISIVIWPVEFLVMIFNPDGIRIGDILAKTIVVKLGKTEDMPVETPDEYKTKYESRKPSNWKKVLIITIVATAVFVSGIITFINGIGSIMRNSEAYKTAIAQIENNKEITSQIGEIKGYGFMPTGSISITNGYGKADLTIKVKGEKKNIRVHTKLDKEPDSEWQIVQFDVLD